MEHDSDRLTQAKLELKIVRHNLEKTRARIGAIEPFIPAVSDAIIDDLNKQFQDLENGISELEVDKIFCAYEAWYYERTTDHLWECSIDDDEIPF